MSKAYHAREPLRALQTDRGDRLAADESLLSGWCGLALVAAAGASCPPVHKAQRARREASLSGMDGGGSSSSSSSSRWRTSGHGAPPCRSLGPTLLALLPATAALGFVKIYLSAQGAQIINQCLSQFPNAQRDLTTLNENASQDTKCFINCIAQSEGLVSNGNLSMSATIAYFDRQTALMGQMGVIVDGTTFNALRQNCFTLGTNATCDAVYQQFLCVRRALQSSISYIGRRRRRQEQRPEVPGVAASFYLASSQVTRNT
ncbi:uncharacterized protein LOC126088190 [Schistocerca cancellata]|uniref:uncharacterized protein LOC126088190 n=1 Tax=Schistocerca cancellata TaxID=274614 RepID=UPI00211996BB|nr:uncharacterized protein LOC126088190 [Schistocerca cancellata]